MSSEQGSKTTSNKSSGNNKSNNNDSKKKGKGGGASSSANSGPSGPRTGAGASSSFNNRNRPKNKAESSDKGKKPQNEKEHEHEHEHEHDNEQGQDAKSASNDAATNVNNKKKKTNNKKSSSNNNSNKNNAESNSPAAAAAADTSTSGPVCFICADPVSIWSLGPCSHRLCHMCCLRLRALYQNDECAFCKASCPSIIFTSDPSKPFSEFKSSDTPFKDDKLNILFETQNMQDEALSLLRFNCPSPKCKYYGTGWDDLRAHVSKAHQKRFCELCINNLKVFSHEHALFNTKQLETHISKGTMANSSSSSSNAAPDGFTGHPRCEFCKINFYDDDALYRHLKHDHEQCFICVRNGVRDQYFLDYPNLEHHFQTSHYMCKDPQCLEQKFVVFDSELDLQAHRLSEHLSDFAGDKRALAAARRIEPQFNYGAEPSTPSSSSSSSRRNRRGGGPRSITIGDSNNNNNNNRNNRSSGPSSGARGRRTTAFSGQLSSNDEQQEESSLGLLNTNADGSSLNDEQVARRTAVFEDVNDLVSNSSTKLASFRQSVRAYRNSELNPESLINSLFDLFGENRDATKRIITSIAQLLDNDEKRKDLLKVLNDFESQEAEAFPSLSGASNPMYGGASWGTSGIRANRSQPSRQRQQENLLNLAQSQNNARRNVPGMPSQSTGLTVNPSRPTFITATAPSMPPRNDTESFPALPASSTPSTTPASSANTPRRSNNNSNNGNTSSNRNRNTSNIVGAPSAYTSAFRPAQPPRPIPGLPGQRGFPPSSQSSPNWRTNAPIINPGSNGEFPGLPSTPGQSAAARRSAQKAALFANRSNAPSNNANPWFDPTAAAQGSSSSSSTNSNQQQNSRNWWD